MDQNINFSSSDQIQTPQYPVVHPPSQEKSEEVSQAREDLIKSIETFLEEFHCISLEEKPLILLQEDPPQDSNIHQLIEECSVEVSEEQKQKMKDTMIELVKICQEKEFLCIHDNVEDLIESALNSKLLLINLNSQRLDKKEQKVKNVVEQPAERRNLAPILSTEEPEHSLSMGYEHLSITFEMEYDEVTKSNAENLLPIPSECEVTLEDKKECDVPIFENSPICDDHSEIFSDFKIDDNISVYDDDFKDMKYVEASLSDPEIVSVEEENGVEEENVVQ
nr:hypothetical protein [Tanacetum cinerariifolium]